MNHLATLSACAIAALTLTACSEQEDVPKNVVKNLEYYLENDTERLAMNKRCEDNPTLFQTDGNCNHAEEARRHKKLDAIGRAIENK